MRLFSAAACTSQCNIRSLRTLSIAIVFSRYIKACSVNLVFQMWRRPTVETVLLLTAVQK